MTRASDTAKLTSSADIIGDITGSTINADGDTAAGDNAAMGYTASEGLILTGQGSTNDITVKNDADADVITIATGTTVVGIPGSLDIEGAIDVNGTANLDVVDIDGAVNMATTALVTGVLTANGGAVFNEGSADVDFRVESNGNANMLFVDGGNDKVGIGTNSPGAGLTLEGTADNLASQIKATASGVVSQYMGGSSSLGLAIGHDHASLPISFRTGVTSGTGVTGSGTERLRVGVTSISIGNTNTNARITLSQNGNALNLMRLQNSDGTNNARFIQFANSGDADCGHIDQVNATTIAYNTTSDYRLKQNIDYTFDATTEVKKLKPCTFSWKHDATDKSVYGFLAHEVSEIVSEAASGTKDATRDIGTIKSKDGDITAKNAPQAQANTDENETWEKTGTENVYQGYDAGKLVPLLVKTIQELEARITKLEG